MKGSVFFRKDRGIWVIAWYIPELGKNKLIYRDYQTGDYFYERRRAEKQLSHMQLEVESGTFRLERYTKEIPTDVVPYLWEWYDAVKNELKPATQKDYRSSIKNHLEPFFSENPYQLNQIQWDVILKLKNWIPRIGKGKMNVMYCLHACLDHAWRSGKIQAIPPFPKKKQYRIQRKKPKTVSEKKQLEILNTIEPEHQPIFYFMKHHFRRPGEACALMKEDFENGDFTIHRTFSDKRLTDTTKTGEIHEISMIDPFRPHYRGELAKQKKLGVISPFFFVNPYGRKKGKHYTVSQLERIWNRACEKVGTRITLYQGIKHTSCAIALNDWGLSISDLQTVTDHARRESVLHYGEVEKRRRKELMEGKVLRLRNKSGDVLETKKGD